MNACMTSKTSLSVTENERETEGSAQIHKHTHTLTGKEMQAQRHSLKREQPGPIGGGFEHRQEKETASFVSFYALRSNKSFCLSSPGDELG